MLCLVEGGCSGSIRTELSYSPQRTPRKTTTRLVVKITSLVITSAFNLRLISLASFASFAD
jgi:hypothetical protein